MTAPFSTDVAVIGGGIIGLCVAERLAHDGLAVAIVERERIAAGASAGNAASFAFSEVMPLASPAMIRKAVKWFFDPTGPFSVVPQDLPATVGWLMKFALSARKAVVESSVRTLTTLMSLERETLPAALARMKLAHMVHETGALYLYRSLAALDADRGNWDRLRRVGTESEVLQGQALHEFQDGLSDKIIAAVHVPKYEVVSDPKHYCHAVHDAVSSNRVVTAYDHVERLEAGEDGVVLHGPRGPVARARHVVLAAGPWSATLAAHLGDRLPLIGERGYNTTLPRHAFPALDKPLVFTSEGFVMVPLEDGVRVGGASEIASLERAPNYQRSRAMLKRARALVPGLRDVDGVEWMGLRPTTPDTLPVIGRASAMPNVIYAFGHGHLGLTLATSTARLVSDLIADRPPSIDLAALDPRRF